MRNNEVNKKSGSKQTVMIRIFLLMVIMLLVYVGILTAEGLGVLINGNFEGLYENGIAAGWKDNSGWANVRVHYSREREKSHHGLAQKIECTSFKSGAVQFVQFGVSVAKGHSYQVEIWMKGDVKTPVEISVRKRGRPYMKYLFKEFHITDQWEKYSFIGVSEDDSKSALFMIRYTSIGRLWLDDASIIDITDKTSTAPPQMGNLISNGSFEVGLDRWGILIREFGGYQYEMPISYRNHKPRIKKDSPIEGKHYLEVDIPRNGRLVITSLYMKVNQGRKHSLSCWLSSDHQRTVTIGLRKGGFLDDKMIQNDVSVGKEWKRYELSASLPPTPGNVYYFLLESIGEGKLRIDGVSLEEGDVSPFNSRRLFEVGFQREDVPTIYQIGETIDLTVLLSASSSGKDAKLLITSHDYFGKGILLREMNLSFSSDKRQEVFFRHPNNRLGYFRIVTEVWEKERMVDVAEMAIGVVPKPLEIQSLDQPFGNHVRFNKDQLDAAKKVGISWLRMHPPLGTKWFVVEKERGQFVFYDEPILLAKSLNFNILGTLDTTPRWASSEPHEKVSEEMNGYRSYPAKNLADWEEYVYKIVYHYKGIIDFWEVWNEPDSHFLNVKDTFFGKTKPRVYSDLLKAAYKAAKKANPDAVIVGGCASQKPPANWFREIFKYGAYDYMDILSFHSYTGGLPGDIADPPAKFYIDELKALIHTYGKGQEKPIWETESGVENPASNYGNIFELSYNYANSANEGPSYLVRNYVYLLLKGISKWFYYSMFVSNRIDRRECTGFFEWDGSPRPLLVAHAVFSRILGNGKFYQELDIPEGFFGAKFRDDTREVSIAWLKEGQDIRELQVPVKNTKNITVFNIMGNKISAHIEKDSITVPVGRDPIYIIESRFPAKDQKNLF